jgi:hypothetical protein
MMRSYQITICGYTVFADKKEHINRFSFRDKNGYQLADSVGIVFVELTKLEDILRKPREQMTPADT